MRSEQKLNQLLGYKVWQKGKAEALSFLADIDAIYADHTKTPLEQKNAVADLLVLNKVRDESEFHEPTPAKN